MDLPRGLLAWLLTLSTLALCVGPGCGTTTEDCATNEDEDGDGDAGCADHECWVPGGSCPEVCTSQFDEDADGFFGCFDSDCWVNGGVCQENCESDSDEDADGLVSCLDSDCWVLGSGCAETCDGGNDEDGDGDVDCADSDCWLGGVCEEACEGGDDEDGDGDVDCDDADCVSALSCAPTFSGDTQSIFMEHCAANCHTAGFNLGQLSFDSYDDMSLNSYYCPGETKAACSLFRILEPSMPQNCLNCLPQTQIDVLQAWVDAGIPP
jgi:hypothetical protein